MFLFEMLPLMLIFYGVIGYVLYLFVVKLNSQLEQKILRQLLTEVYLYDCEIDNVDAFGDGGNGEVRRKKSEIPVMKLYEAPNRSRSRRNKNHIEPKRTCSSVDLPLKTKKSKFIRHSSAD